MRSFMTDAATTLLMVNEIGRDNPGVTLDFGHSLMGIENPAEAAAILKMYGDTLSTPASDAGDSFINVASDAKLEICGGSTCRATCSNGTISGNAAGTNGSGIYMTTTKTSNGIAFSGGTVTGNTAQKGGGLYVTFGSGKKWVSIDVSGISITGNTATADVWHTTFQNAI